MSVSPQQFRYKYLLLFKCGLEEKGRWCRPCFVQAIGLLIQKSRILSENILSFFFAYHNQHAHALAELIEAFKTPECHGLRLFPFIRPEPTLLFIICGRYPWFFQERQIILHIFSHPSVQVVAISVIRLRRDVFIFLPCLLQDLPAASLIIRYFVAVRGTLTRNRVCVMNHFLQCSRSTVQDVPNLLSPL